MQFSVMQEGFKHVQTPSAQHHIVRSMRGKGQQNVSHQIFAKNRSKRTKKHGVSEMQIIVFIAIERSKKNVFVKNQCLSFSWCREDVSGGMASWVLVVIAIAIAVIAD